MQITFAHAYPANSSFDIVYVNLERHGNKRVHIEQMLKHANCTFRRFNAVDGQELCSKKKSIKDYTKDIRIVPTDDSIHQRINTKNAGRAGCHLSHLIILREIDVSDTDRPVLVLEDDIDLDEFFVEKVEEVIANPPGKWDIILLGGIVNEKWWKRRRNKHLVAVHYEACLHAYLVNGARSAKRVADTIDSIQCPGRPVDLIIQSAFRDDRSFAFYCFSPMIGVQRRDLFESDITISRSTPFYMKYLKNPFPRAFIRPLRNSLLKASSPEDDGMESTSAQLEPLCILLLLSTYILM